MSIPKDAVKKKPNMRLNELAKQVEQLGEAQVAVLATHFPKMMMPFQARIQDLEKKQSETHIRADVIEAKLAEPLRWPRFVVVLALATYCLALTLWAPARPLTGPPMAYWWGSNSSKLVNTGGQVYGNSYTLGPKTMPEGSPTTTMLADNGYFVPSHKFIVSAPEGCWIGAGSDDEAAKKQAPQYTALLAETLVVRDGCPGKATFVVDGKEVHPENRAANKKTVELVTLP